MKTLWAALAVMAVALWAIPAWAGEEASPADPGMGQKETPAKAQEACPVMGGPVNRNQYADYQGKRVYFCCGACVRTFKADPEKYIKQLEAQGVELERTPAKE